MNEALIDTLRAPASLPFEGASLTSEADDTPNDPEHPELHQLDLNPRYRRIPAFHSQFLPDDRTVRIYLPQAYLSEPTRHFPVFYLHDGQNLFDGRTSYVAGHTWRAHLTADRLTAAGLMQPTILVGVDNTGTRRMDEYTPTRDRHLGGGEGASYGRLLIEDLKPLLDANLRTLPDAANTALGGSSLGGLISLALGLEHPDIFGKLTVMSPSVWWDARSILTAVHYSHLNRPPRLWLDMGMSEGLRHLRDCDLLHKRLQSRGWQESINLRYLRVPGAVHNEDSWADRFDQVLQFLFPPTSGAPHLAS